MVSAGIVQGWQKNRVETSVLGAEVANDIKTKATLRSSRSNARYSTSANAQHWSMRRNKRRSFPTSLLPQPIGTSRDFQVAVKPLHRRTTSRCCLIIRGRSFFSMRGG
jgi:hypothetical protein